MKQVQVLGKLVLFDKNLSVNRNEACSFCHMPETDFTGPISILNQTTVSYPGSVRHRFGHRKPQSYTYASFYPVLQYNQTQQDFYGGNFWDLRATGYKLQSPAAEQAQGPPVDPNEMGFADTACVVHRLSAEFVPTAVRDGLGRTGIRHPVAGGCRTSVQHARSSFGERSVSRASGQGGPRPFELHLRPVCVVRSPVTKLRRTSARFPRNSTMRWRTPDKTGVESGRTGRLDPVSRPREVQYLPSGRDGEYRRAAEDAGQVKPGNAASVAPLFTDFTSNNLGLPRNLVDPVLLRGPARCVRLHRQCGRQSVRGRRSGRLSARTGECQCGLETAAPMPSTENSRRRPCGIPTSGPVRTSSKLTCTMGT